MTRPSLLVSLLLATACGGSVGGGEGLITGSSGSDNADAPAPSPPVETKPGGGATGPGANDEKGSFLPTPLLVLPLGDDITQGDANHDSYRRSLWRRMESAGWAADFIGTNTGNYGGAPPRNDFDADNEGHWGARADELVTRVARADYSPDVVLMHLGTNDALQRQSAQSTLADYRALIGELRDKNPEVIVLVAKLIGLQDTKAAKAVDGINDALPDFVAAITTADSPVILVDQASGFSVAELTYDGTHPSSAGEERMAAIWLAAINALGTQE